MPIFIRNDDFGIKPKIDVNDTMFLVARNKILILISLGRN